METNRRQYSKEFKKEAVEYSLASEERVEEVAHDLGISVSNLRRWRTQYKKRGELAFPVMARKGSLPRKKRREGLKKNLPIPGSSVIS
mgnify:CR=1 FL=1